MNDQYTDFYYISDDLKYMSIYYYGMIMLVGNEIAPQQFPQYIFAASMTITGSVFMAWLFGSIAATVASLSQKDTEHADKLDLV